MSNLSTFKDVFIEDTLDVMDRALVLVLPKELDKLSDPIAKKWQTHLTRQTILHLLGNMIVLAFAGLEHAIRKERLDDYRRVMLSVEKLRPRLQKHEFELPPQIEEAVALVKNPLADY